jgi:hypothetical protein
MSSSIMKKILLRAALTLLLTAQGFSAQSFASNLSPEEQGVKRWFDAVMLGNRAALYDAACRDAAAMMGIADLFTDGSASGLGGLAVLLQFDYSKLNYQLLKREDNRAYVLVTGLVGEPKSLLDLRRDWVPFEDVGRRRGVSNIAVVVYERGAWRHCDYLSLQQARNFRP